MLARLVRNTTGRFPAQAERGAESSCGLARGADRGRVMVAGAHRCVLRRQAKPGQRGYRPREVAVRRRETPILTQNRTSRGPSFPTRSGANRGHLARGRSRRCRGRHAARRLRSENLGFGKGPSIGRSRWRHGRKELNGESELHRIGMTCLDLARGCSTKRGTLIGEAHCVGCCCVSARGSLHPRNSCGPDGLARNPVPRRRSRDWPQRSLVGAKSARKGCFRVRT